MLYRREGFPEEDELVLCTVTKILGHAVFVNLDEYEKGGLVHISEIAAGRIRNIREYVEVNKKIVCKVLRVDTEKGHIDLSLRRVSEMEKKKKLEDIKQEQKAEKVIEIIAKELGKKAQEIYDAVTNKVFESYPFVHLFFKDAASGNANVADFISDSKLAKVLQEHVQERFKAAKVEIKGIFTLQSFAPNGVEVIKDALIAARKKITKKADVSVLYAGGGKYKAKIEAESYKEAEQALKQLEEFIIKEVKSNEGEASFAREEE